MAYIPCQIQHRWYLTVITGEIPSALKGTDPVCQVDPLEMTQRNELLQEGTKHTGGARFRPQ